MENQEGFAVPSQKQLEEQGGGEFVPLAENVYIVKIAKITLDKTTAYINNIPSKDKMTARWNVTLLPYEITGEEMKDTKGGKVEPLTRRVWLRLSLNSYGFKKDGTPSMLRSFIANVKGEGVTEQLNVKNYVVIDDNGNFISDAEKRKECATNGIDGYTLGADITEFEGKYVRATISLVRNAKGVLVNKVTGFMRLPATFQPNLQLESEVMAKFNEGWDRKLIDMENQGTSMVLYTKDGERKRTESVNNNVVEEEMIRVEEIAFN